MGTIVKKMQPSLSSSREAGVVLLDCKNTSFNSSLRLCYNENLKLIPIGIEGLSNGVALGPGLDLDAAWLPASFFGVL